jgi:hypothetical protein
LTLSESLSMLDLGVCSIGDGFCSVWGVLSDLLDFCDLVGEGPLVVYGANKLSPGLSVTSLPSPGTNVMAPFVGELFSNLDEVDAVLNLATRAEILLGLLGF